MRDLGWCMLAFFSKGLTYFLAFIRVWRLGVCLNTPPLSAQRLCWQDYAYVLGVYFGVWFCKARWGLERSCQLPTVPALRGWAHSRALFTSEGRAFRVTLISTVLTPGHIQPPFLVPTDVTRDLVQKPLPQFPCVVKKVGTRLVKERSSVRSLAQGGVSLKSSPLFCVRTTITESSETRLEHRRI